MNFIFMQFFLFLGLLPFQKDFVKDKNISKEVVCGPHFRVVNSTSVTIQEVSVYGNYTGLLTTFTNVSAFSSTSTVSTGGNTTNSVCIKVTSVPSGGAYFKIWNGSILIDCMYISTGSQIPICTFEDFSSGCNLYDIELTTTPC